MYMGVFPPCTMCMPVEVRKGRLMPEEGAGSSGTGVYQQLLATMWVL